MKTLTLYRACVLAEGDRIYLLKKSSPYRGDKYSIRANKRRRQRDKFDKALTKRLQEQEELIAVLREYRDASKEEIHDLKMQRKDLIEALKEK